jgi:hypothetical protein
MAKKKVAKKKAAPATKKAPKKKAAEKKPADAVEFKLSPVEEKALDLVQSSKELCKDLETAVTESISVAVQKVYKAHKIALTSAQAQNVALLLFGD